jgi:hypothetical protein
MQNWEYQTLSLIVNKGMFGNTQYDPQPLDQQINQLGERGWEVVSIVGITTNGWTDQLLVTLKRPR